MAGSIITMPTNGAADWSAFVTIVEKTYRGYIGISLSAIDTTSAPTIEDGSVIEIGGSIYQFTTAEAFTGWGSTGTTGDVFYMVAVPSGTTATVVFTASAPTWSGAKNGWYDSNDRYFGELEWGGSATYSDKVIYQRFNDNSDDYKMNAIGGIRTTDSGVFFKQKVIPMDAWDMDGTASISASHGLVFANIRGLRGVIGDDPGANWYSIFHGNDASPYSHAWAYIGTSEVFAIRAGAGFFDSVNFDGSGNRGYWIIDYI